jgi:hypothetical protein
MGRDGLPFEWVLAPDNSVLISLGYPDGNWSIKRITHWETPKPDEETRTFADDFPDPVWNDVGKPIINPTGRYLVIRPGYRRKLDASGKQISESMVAVVDLLTFTLAKTSSDIAFGDLYFNKDGALMLLTMHGPGLFEYTLTALSLPELAPIATCDYNVQDRGLDPKTGLFGPVPPASESCPSLLSVAHVSKVRELPSYEKHRLEPDHDTRFEGLAGPHCFDVELNSAKSLALYRCGTELFGYPSGDFGIMFWKSLKVLSVPDGKTILSLPLNFHDDKTWGLFAQARGYDYLVVRHGLKLKTYRLR